MEIKDIKERLSIIRVLEHYNLKPDKNSRLCCPFHDDKTPSMQVYPETNTVFCFSSNCKLHGKAIDQIDFIMHKEGISKHEAILKAKSMLNGAETKAKETMKPPQQGKGKDFQEIHNHLKELLPRSKKALHYLKSRNLDHKKLGIGYNIQTKINGKTGYHYDYLKECIIFPLRDKQNNIASLYGRSIHDRKESKHFYMKGRKGLYPNYPAANTQTLILTESIIDTATVSSVVLTKEGYINYTVLALYGTNGLTPEHIAAIQELKELKEIILFFDGDEAGEKAAKRYSKELHNIKPSIAISKVETPKEEDPNSLLQSHEPEILQHLIEQRKEIFLSTENPILFEKENQQQANGPSNKESQQPQAESPNYSLPITNCKLNTSNPEYITFATNELKIALLGGINLNQLDRLRATIKITRKGSPDSYREDPTHSIRHSLDLYNSDQLERFINKATDQLECGTTAVKQALAELIDQLENYRLKRQEAKKSKKPKQRELTETQRRKAIKYLSSPNLMERTNKDIGKTGMVGEENNRLLMYLIFTSRLREQPLHIISLGASGTGKTYLQEKISELIPEHDKLEITILSENAFYYFGQQELKNKLVLIEDMDGAENVLYPLRELQSKRKISKTIPIKDSKGNLKTITLNVEGPICLAGTTTKEKLYEDNANRSLLIYLDNSSQHRESIMKYQRKLSAGKIATAEEDKLEEFFKDMQTILKPIKVRNPYAEYLVIPQHVFKPLRTNSHYLAFVETVTFYHQYQRETKTDSKTGEKYIETTIEDIEWANKLLKDVLLAKSDELSGECRRFFENLKRWLDKEQKQSFYKNEARENFRMNPNNLKYYLVQLLKYGYIKIVGGNKYKSGYEYEISNVEEYKELRDNLGNALDAALDDIKKNTAGNVDNKKIIEPVTHSTI